MRTPRVLVVDDNADILEMLTVLLGEKYCVVSCGSAAEALTAVAGARPDVLMLDIRMTPVDGTACLEAIRALPGYKTIPAIALTAFAREAERQAFLAAGFQAVITKPMLDPRELETAIDKLLTSPCSGATLTRASDDRMISDRGGGKK